MSQTNETELVGELKSKIGGFRDGLAGRAFDTSEESDCEEMAEWLLKTVERLGYQITPRVSGAERSGRRRS
jgi:hypothetical protein